MGLAQNKMKIKKKGCKLEIQGCGASKVLGPRSGVQNTLSQHEGMLTQSKSFNESNSMSQHNLMALMGVHAWYKRGLLYMSHYVNKEDNIMKGWEGWHLASNVRGWEWDKKKGIMSSISHFSHALLSRLLSTIYILSLRKHNTHTHPFSYISDQTN